MKRHQNSKKNAVRSKLLEKQRRRRNLRFAKDFVKQTARQEFDDPVEVVIRKKRKIWNSERRAIVRELYRKRRYAGLPRTFKIVGEFGLEHNFDSFISIAKDIIDTDANQLNFDLSECTRFWPSGVTMFASLVSWFRLTSDLTIYPVLRSSDSKTDAVTSYLDHCGFHNFVGRRISNVPSIYGDKEVVKIKRELSVETSEQRQLELRDLVKQHSVFTEEEVDLFNCVILSEIFINVTEHGVHYRGLGWFTIGQVHPKTGIISLCVADNGIGIKNSLLTGQQRQEISKILEVADYNDAEFIKKAFEQNISGAIEASVQEGLPLMRRYPKGKRRGMGLDRIRKACKSLGVQLDIISHSGAIRLGFDGNFEYEASTSSRCFAGTLYHLTIRARNGT